MAEALTWRGHVVDVVTYPLGDETQPIAYKIHRVAGHYKRLNPEPGPSLAKLLYLDPLLCARIRKLLIADTFDVIHAHHYEGLIASLFARQLSRRIPIVYDAHTLLQSELPHYRVGLPHALKTSLGRTLDRRVPTRADHVIAVADSIRQWFTVTAAIPPDRISVIENGVEIEHFGDQVRADFKRTTGPHIVFAGNLAEYQGVDLLLRAFLRVRDIINDARLSLLTDSALGDVSSKINKMGISDSVSFLDPDYASLPAKLATADVLVNPRIDCDGIPQKLLNYMATGRPIVSFMSSAVLLEHERNALIVADGDTDGFADAILRLIREPEFAQSLGSAAKSKVISGYSWQKVAERVESVYERVVGPSA